MGDPEVFRPALKETLRLPKTKTNYPPFIPKMLELMGEGGITLDAYDHLVARAQTIQSADHIPFIEKEIATKVLRYESNDASGLIGNLLDVATTPEIILSTLFTYAEPHIRYISSLSGQMQQELKALLGGTGWSADAALIADSIFEGYLYQLKQLRGPKAYAYWAENKAVLQAKETKARLEYAPEIYQRRVYNIRQTLVYYSIPHPETIQRLVPQCLRMDSRIPVDLRNHAFFVSAIGQAGSSLAIVAASEIQARRQGGGSLEFRWLQEIVQSQEKGDLFDRVQDRL